MGIHPTAVVDGEAKIHPTVEIGPHTVIGKGVSIYQGCKIGPSVYIEGETIIRENCQISAGAVIGTPPQDWKYRGEKTRVVIGEGTIIREYVTINRGTAVRGETKIGKNCFLMAYAHVAHDCSIGDGVILANNATLAGHVEVADHAILGGLVAVHQYVRIGELALLGGGAMVPLDVPPYMCACGDRARLYGLNTIGLRRHGYKRQTIRNLKRAYRILFRCKLPLKEALDKLREKFRDPAVARLEEFIRATQRGICRE